MEHTQLPVQAGGLYRLRATVLNVVDHPIVADRFNLCTWTLRADVPVEQVSRECDPPDSAFLAPSDSTTLEVVVRVGGPPNLDAVRLEDSDGKAMLADRASRALPPVDEPIDSAAVRVPYVLELSADEGLPVQRTDLEWVVERGISTAAGGRFIPVLVGAEAATQMARSWPVLRMQVKVGASRYYSVAGCWWTEDDPCSYVASHGEGGLLLVGAEVLDAVQTLMAHRKGTR